jgi:5-methylthioribose kinase
MRELTADNALPYLREHGLVGDEPCQVELLGWGVSNVVLRVQAGSRLFVLKQSRPQLRTRDAWFSDLARVYREQEVMEYLHSRLPDLVVPRVLFSERQNYVFAMTHAPQQSRVWKETLLAGEIDLGLGELAGEILGRIHQITAEDPTLAERFGDRIVFIQLRVDPFYRRIQERRPETAVAVARVIDRMLATSSALCHGDYSPKNILTHDHGFTLVDYETAHWGDPTMDLGFFLSHLLLKTVKRCADQQRFLDLTRNFWRGYGREVRFRPLRELTAEGIAHCGVCLLARIDGTSPVDYLPEEPNRDLVRELGRRILVDRLRTWEDVTGLLENLLTKVMG